MLAVPLLSLVACGGGSADDAGSPAVRPQTAKPSDVKHAIERSYNAFYRATRKGDGDAACSLMTARYQQELVREAKQDQSSSAVKGDTCAAVVKDGAKLVQSAIPADATFTFSRFKLSADGASHRATIPTSFGSSITDVFYVFSDDRWKVDHDVDVKTQR